MSSSLPPLFYPHRAAVGDLKVQRVQTLGDQTLLFARPHYSYLLNTQEQNLRLIGFNRNDFDGSFSRGTADPSYLVQLVQKSSDLKFSYKGAPFNLDTHWRCLLY